MDNLINSLSLCFLFNNFEKEHILKIINSINYKITKYEKGETIAIEGDRSEEHTSELQSQ
mgnify:CR=1 FL=1